MSVVAFRMKLRPGCQGEYQRRHAEIWPELLALLSDSGISNYRIFLDEPTGMLFAIQTVSAGSSQSLGQSEIVQRWWAYMADLMDVNADNSPVSVPLREVFHLA